MSSLLLISLLGLCGVVGADLGPGGTPERGGTPGAAAEGEGKPAPTNAAEATAALKAVGVYASPGRRRIYASRGGRGPRDVSDREMAYLRFFPEATMLDFPGAMRVTDEGFAHVADLPNLRWIRFYHSPIQGSGLAALRGMGGLEDLDLWDTRVGDAALANVAGPPSSRC
jgi:hypothetical protein